MSQADYLLFRQGQLKGFQSWQHYRHRLSFVNSGSWEEIHEDNPSGETHFFPCPVASDLTYLASQMYLLNMQDVAPTKPYRTDSTYHLSLVFPETNFSSPEVLTLDSQHCPWKGRTLWSKRGELHTPNPCLYKGSGKGEFRVPAFTKLTNLTTASRILQCSSGRVFDANAKRWIIKWTWHSELLSWLLLKPRFLF